VSDCSGETCQDPACVERRRRRDARIDELRTYGVDPAAPGPDQTVKVVTSGPFKGRMYDLVNGQWVRRRGVK
jgi:hypothetical protein